MSQDASGLNPTNETAQNKLTAWAFWMAFGTMTSRILGLVRDMAMAAYFDRTITDAWTAAFRIPNLFRRLLGEGSLSISFIPVLVDLQNQDSSGIRVRNLINSFYFILLFFMGTGTLLGLIFMEPLLKFILDDSYFLQPGQLEITLKMARIMFAFVFLIFNYAYFAGILQALNEYTWPSFAPAFFNLAMLVFTFTPDSYFHFPGEGLAWGVLVGGVLQVLVLMPLLVKHNKLPFFVWNGYTKDLKKVLVRLLPGLLGLGLIHFITVINLHFASAMGPGVLSAIYWADRLLELPLSLVAVSIGSTLLPTLSNFWTQNKRAEFVATADEQIVKAGVLLVPAAMGLFVLAGPIVETLFLRGHFSIEDLSRTTLVLQIYALSLIVLTLLRLFLPLLYAMQKTWWPAFAAFTGLTIHFFGASFWIEKMGLRGLIFSTLLCSFINLIVVLLVLSREVNLKFSLKILFKYFQFGLLSLPMFACPWIYLWINNEGIYKIISLAIAVSFAVAIYFILGRLFKAHIFFLKL